MTDRSADDQASRARNVSWVPALAGAGCLAIALAIASPSLGARWGFRFQVAALGALAVTATALSLRQMLGGLPSRALRLAVAGPIVFSIVLVIVLALDAAVRAGALLG